MRNQTSYLWIVCSDALPLNHRDTVVSEVYYKVHMTHVLQTAGISNVHSIMFVNWIREMVSFELGKEIKMFFIYYEHRIKKNSESSNYFFFVSHTRDKQKTSFPISLNWAQNLPSLRFYLCQNLLLTLLTEVPRPSTNNNLDICTFDVEVEHFLF